MTITGKDVLKIVYISSLIFHPLFIGYQLILGNTLSSVYLMLFVTSITLMTLLLKLSK